MSSAETGHSHNWASEGAAGFVEQIGCAQKAALLQQLPFKLPAIDCALTEHYTYIQASCRYKGGGSERLSARPNPKLNRCALLPCTRPAAVHCAYLGCKSSVQVFSAGARLPRCLQARLWIIGKYSSRLWYLQKQSRHQSLARIPIAVNSERAAACGSVARHAEAWTVWNYAADGRRLTSSFLHPDS